ncbi:hypothetical protein [Flexibacterium corallicola]|uniref:hypothetical protein n=1 Tax=Flexibacterium corallicola TaxID=3037259 RepID=UPI00286F3F5B|nr:hypothetical protein [Pseudovibrio sp. M1P-2-3]
MKFVSFFSILVVLSGCISNEPDDLLPEYLSATIPKNGNKPTHNGNSKIEEMLSQARSELAAPSLTDTPSLTASSDGFKSLTNKTPPRLSADELFREFLSSAPALLTAHNNINSPAKGSERRLKGQVLNRAEQFGRSPVSDQRYVASRRKLKTTLDSYKQHAEKTEQQRQKVQKGSSSKQIQVTELVSGSPISQNTQASLNNLSQIAISEQRTIIITIGLSQKEKAYERLLHAQKIYKNILTLLPPNTRTQLELSKTLPRGTIFLGLI